MASYYAFVRTELQGVAVFYMRLYARLYYRLMRKRNPASELAKKRWKRMTAEQRSAVARELNRRRWQGKSKAEKRAAASDAAKRRWARWRKDNGKSPKPGDESYA